LDFEGLIRVGSFDIAEEKIICSSCYWVWATLPTCKWALSLTEYLVPLRCKQGDTFRDF
jgi:hypothetical protein